MARNAIYLVIRHSPNYQNIAKQNSVASRLFLVIYVLVIYDKADPYDEIISYRGVLNMFYLQVPNDKRYSV